MTVKFVSISRHVDDIAPDTSSLLAYCARVSSTANQNNYETGGKLLRSLVRRKEWSPFEMVSLTMEIVTTRVIARQILRHRSFSFQEFSQRYAAVSEYADPREARLQDPLDRQNSIEFKHDLPGLHEWWEEAQKAVVATAEAMYTGALKRGIAKEVARTVLPEGLTVSRLYMAGNLRSWIHYVQLRTAPGTQKEHRLIAQGCADIIGREFPDLIDVIMGEAV